MVGSQKVKERITAFIKMSQAEYQKFKGTGDDNHLAQAGEKLWNAFGMIVEKIVKKKVKKFRELKNAVFEIYSQYMDSSVLLTFENAYDLHKFFYRGWTEDISIEEEQYKLVADLIEILRKRYGV